MKKVKVIWGMFKGETGEIVERSGKNITVKLDNKPHEVALSTDHVEEVKSGKIIDKIKEVFGDNFIIKSKRVAKLVNEDLYEFVEDNFYSHKTIYRFRVSAELSLHATQMKSGKWWIQA